MTDPRRIIEIDYTNWRGERRNRRVAPTGRLLFENNEWHPETQWLLEAVDCEDSKIKTFALAQIHGAIREPTLRAALAAAPPAVLPIEPSEEAVKAPDYEREARNLANLWTNGNHGARTCILAALERAYRDGLSGSPRKAPNNLLARLDDASSESTLFAEAAEEIRRLYFHVTALANWMEQNGDDGNEPMLFGSVIANALATLDSRPAPAEGWRLVPLKLLKEAHAVMRACGWQLAPGSEPQSDGVLELAAAEIEDKFRELLAPPAASSPETSDG